MTGGRRCLLGALLGCCLLSAAAAAERERAATEPPAREPPAGASDGVDIHSDRWLMRVTALADDILRVRAVMGTDLPEDASWAVPEAMRGHSVNVSVKSDADVVSFQTKSLSVRIERSPLRLIVPRYWHCRDVRSLSRSINWENPRIAFIGVRISCDMLAKNTLLARLACCNDCS